MNRRAILPGLLLLVSFAAAAFGQTKETTLFGQLSEGDPEARTILESLCSDTEKMLKTLIKAAAHKGTDESQSTSLWNQALQAHADLWGEKVGEAKKKSRARMLDEAGNPRSEMVKDAVKSWPADWKTWGDAQYRFFSQLVKSDFIGWRYGVNVQIAGLEAGLEKDPKKFKELVDQVKWISDEMKDSYAKAESATTVGQVDKEISRFIRIWKVTGNIERTIKDRKKYIQEFFATEESKPSKHAGGYESARKFLQECDADPNLDPMCKQAAAAFGVQASLALEAYTKKYEEVRTMNKPVLEETLFDEIEGFKGAKFELLKATQVLEAYLHARQEALK